MPISFLPNAKNKAELFATCGERNIFVVRTYISLYNMDKRITPERITELQPGEIFVFGSNLEGAHGGGAALQAWRQWGAVWGQGAGLQGQTYGIPTMHGGPEAIRPYVDEFVSFARMHPELRFLVTEVGCGIAGFRPQEIAPLFRDAVDVANISLPQRFWNVLNAPYVLTPPATLKACITLPASKSISNRALILHALSGGTPRPTHLSACHDTQVMIRALDHMPEVIDIQAAGTAMRFLTAYLSVTPGTHVLTGTARMQQRPIRILVDALRTLGAHIDYEGNEGFPPLRITGDRLTGSELTLPGNVSSQYISALLMIGPMLPDGLRLRLTGDIISRPYIDLTLQLMHDFDVPAAWTAADCIQVPPGRYRDTAYRVESDWSAASYWYQLVALAPSLHAPEVELLGLFEHSPQGDRRGAELFARLGVHTDFTARGVRLTRQGTPPARLDADLKDIPDLAQTFVVTCCLMGIPFCFTGLQSLRIKETDRIQALITELRKLGYVVLAEGDNLLRWDSERCPADEHPAIDTYEDHRMAMAFAPASLVCPGLRINRPQVVSKSYPHYWDDLQAAGFRIDFT